MKFGFTLKPDHTIERTLALTRQAEAAGFEYAWLFDSHVLWQEAYVLLTLMATASERLRLGTCVTNPATREPSVTASALATLNQVSGGRMDLGIGRGDSDRRVLGKGPTTMATLEEAIHLIRDLVEGRPCNWPTRTSYAGSWARSERRQGPPAAIRARSRSRPLRRPTWAKFRTVANGLAGSRRLSATTSSTW